VHTTKRELPIAGLYRLPDDANRDITTLEPGEVILELELPAVEASVYLKAMDRRRWAFPQVGVAAARVAGEVRLGLAGVSPTPWLLDGLEGLDAATPLPRTAWKLDVARALVRRALGLL
jgi:xanthine dehydrogenase YagS FAD-binding subunit